MSTTELIPHIFSTWFLFFTVFRGFLLFAIIIYLFNILISSCFVFMSTTPCEYAIANPISLPTPEVRPKFFSYLKLTLIVSISTNRAINLSAQSYLKVDLLLILKLDLLEIVFFSFE